MRNKKWLQNRIEQLKRELAELQGDSQFCVEQRYVLTTDIERLQDELERVERKSEVENPKEENFDTEIKDPLPCPFCGEVNWQNTHRMNGKASIICNTCGACGPFSDTGVEAYQKWNGRTTSVRYIYSDDVAGKFVTNDSVIRDNSVVKESFTAPEVKTPDEQEWHCCRLERQNGELVCTAEDTDKRRCGNCELRLETGSEQCRCPLMWNTSSIQKRIVDECDELRHVLIDKNQNYGDSALTVPPFANVSIQDALLIRLGDKFKRLESLTHGDEDVVGEPLADTIQDIAGYCVLLLVEMKNIDEKK